MNVIPVKIHMTMMAHGPSPAIAMVEEKLGIVFHTEDLGRDGWLRVLLQT